MGFKNPTRGMSKLLYHIKRILKRKYRYGWSGNFKNWEEAREKTKGYDSENILNKVKSATLKVKKGEAVFERDSVVFPEIEYSWPLLSTLMWVAAKNQGTLSVIDFGGSLGSSYFQNRRFLSGLQDVKWSVVEQPNFVATGSDEIADNSLKFFSSIEDVLKHRGKPDLLIIACTLPYIEQPYELLQRLLSYKIPYILIDNTPFNFQENDRITVQKIHPAIYEASYPCWFLNYKKVKETILSEYSILEEYKNDLYIYLDGEKIQYQGILAGLKN